MPPFKIFAALVVPGKIKHCYWEHITATQDREHYYNHCCKYKYYKMSPHQRKHSAAWGECQHSHSLTVGINTSSWIFCDHRHFRTTTGAYHLLAEKVTTIKTSLLLWNNYPSGRNIMLVQRYNLRNTSKLKREYLMYPLFNKRTLESQLSFIRCQIYSLFNKCE